MKPMRTPIYSSTSWYGEIWRATFLVIVAAVSVATATAACADQAAAGEEALEDRPDTIEASGGVTPSEANKRVIDEEVPLSPSHERIIENLTPPDGWRFDTFKDGASKGLRAYIVESDDGVTDASVVPNDEDAVGLRLDHDKTEHQVTWPIRAKGNLKKTGGGEGDDDDDGPAPAEPALAHWLAVASKQDINAIFINDTRGGDKVVSANLGPDAQGEKKLKIRIDPAPSPTSAITLKIERTAGSAGSGSATFEGGQTTMTLNGGGDDHPDGGKVFQLTLRGGDTSDTPRNMAIKALQGDNLCAQWDFTVFRLGLSAIHSTDDTIPLDVTDEENKNLRAIFLNAFGHANVGHHVYPDAPGSVAGWILVTGRIDPAGINPNDFLRSHEGDGFDFYQTRYSIQYQDDTAVAPEFTLDNQAFGQIEPGLEGDRVADLGPSAGPAGKPEHLYVHMLDGPGFKGLLEDGVGRVRRSRQNFNLWFTYASVRSSEVRKWWAAGSAIKMADKTAREFTYDVDKIDNDDDDDNNVGWNSRTHFTRSLGEPAELKEFQLVTDTIMNPGNEYFTTVVAVDTNGEPKNDYQGDITLSVDVGTAGDAGPPPAGVYITGTPGTADDTLSVGPDDLGATRFSVTPYSEEVVILEAAGDGKSGVSKPIVVVKP